MNEVVKRYRQDYPKRDVAIVGLRDNDGNILLIRNHKLTEWWQPVGGGVDPEDSSPRAAAVREVHEELGISLNPSEITLKFVAPYDFGEGSVYFYEAFVDRTSVIISVDQTEIIDYKWFSIRDSLNLKAFPATAAYLRKLAEESERQA